MSEERKNQENPETQERQENQEKLEKQETEEKLNDREKQERVRRVERRAADAPAGAKARAAGGRVNPEADEQPKEPSPNQPFLDRIVELIQHLFHPEAIEQAYINERDRDLPTLQIRGEYWLECAKLLKTHEELDFRYLRNIAGVDHETHMEVVYHMISLRTKRQCCVKVTTDRDHPSVPSVEPVWPTANWNEREIYDLFGIQFPGHPDLRRIMMPNDWVGHPLRKDYEPYDPEV